MPKLTTEAVARLAGGRTVGPSAEAAGIVDDSHDVRPGLAFAAIARGHGFVAHALHAGAPFVIAERPDVVPDGASAVIVDDTVRALAPVAADIRASLDVPVVAITGSTGKTMTRDLIAAALSPSFRVHRTPKNYNAEIGVPITLFATPDDAQALVLELGARHVGEIAELCAIARPTVGVITGIGTAHIEEFGSREAIARTKAELIASLEDGQLALVPSDDDFLGLLSASTRARLCTVGPGGHVRYRAERIDADGRTKGTVTIDGADVAVDLPVAGRALMRNAAFAMAVAAELGVETRAAAAAIAAADLTSWRMQIVRVGGWTVINDAYNSNPTSIASALRAAREVAGERPLWAVLGPMAELGDATDAEHLRAGRLAAELGFHGVIVVGAEAARIGDAAGAGHPSAPAVIRVGSLAEASEAVVREVPPDAVVVVKASRVAGLERLVSVLEASKAQVS